VPQLTEDNTNALAHRVADDTLVYHCPNCEHGEVPVVGLVQDGEAACLDCERRYEAHVVPVE
jgi:transcription elongation factor Elf1